MRRYANFVLLCLAGATCFYLAYLFCLQLTDPQQKLVLYEPDRVLLTAEVVVVLIAGCYCIVKAFEGRR